MNLFDIFHTKQFDDKTLFVHKEKNLLLKEFKNFVASGVAFLNTQKADNVVKKKIFY